MSLWSTKFLLAVGWLCQSSIVSNKKVTFLPFSPAVAAESSLSVNPVVANHTQASAPVFLMYSLGAELSRVTLVRCRACHSVIMVIPNPSISPHSQLFLGDTELTSSPTSPPAAGLITTPSVMNICPVTQPSLKVFH